MTIEERIAKIMSKVPESQNTLESVERVARATANVRIVAALVGRTETHIQLAIGQSRVDVPIENIASINEEESRPSMDTDWPYVTVEIPPETILLQTRVLLAKQFGPNVGQRPFVYDQPSDARAYSVAADEYQERTKRWLREVGLQDYPWADPEAMPQPSPGTTVYMTQSTTRRSTDYETYYKTSTPGDTSGDSQNDTKSDDQMDWNEDLKNDTSVAHWS